MEALLLALRRAANESHDTLTVGSGFHARFLCVVVAQGFLLRIDDAMGAFPALSVVLSKDSSSAKSFFCLPEIMARRSTRKLALTGNKGSRSSALHRLIRVTAPRRMPSARLGGDERTLGAG